MPAFSQASCVCPVHCPPEGLDDRREAAGLCACQSAEFPDELPVGLLKVRPAASFHPDNPRAGIPGHVRQLKGGLPMTLLPLINATEWAIQSGTWAIVCDNSALLLIPVSSEERPNFPDALPRHVERWEGTKEEAQDEAARRNAEILAVATVPREWWVVLKNPRYRNPLADSVRPRCPEREGAEESRHRHNPLARQLWEEHLPQVEAVRFSLPDCVELNGHTGSRAGKPTTDDECRVAYLDVLQHEFDLTGDIAGQIADLLQNLALEFLQSSIWLRNPAAADDEELAESPAEPTFV